MTRNSVAYGTRRAGPPSDSARCSRIHIRARVLGPIPMDFARYRNWRYTLGVSRTEIPSDSSSSRNSSWRTSLLCRVVCAMKCDTFLWPLRATAGACSIGGQVDRGAAVLSHRLDVGRRLGGQQWCCSDRLSRDDERASVWKIVLQGFSETNCEKSTQWRSLVPTLSLPEGRSAYRSRMGTKACSVSPIRANGVKWQISTDSLFWPGSRVY